MKLLREYDSSSVLELVKEEVDKENSGKQYYLKGPFLEANTLNKNGRKYTKETLLREVKEFYDKKIVLKRSLGELDHPPEPTVNLDRASHIITDLKMDGDIGYGVARLMDTPMGRIAKTLVDEGVQMGMSTRGVGTLDGEYVKDDYKLITVDIVADPSAHSAFVEGVLENKEFIIGKNGQIVETAIRNLEKKVDKKYNKYSRKDMSTHTLNYLSEFLSDLKTKII